MFRARILSTLPTKEREYLRLEDAYLKRFVPKGAIQIEEMGGERLSSHPVEQQQKAHTEAITKRLEAKEILFLLDEKGPSFSTVAFAREIEKLTLAGSSSLAFAIGGAYGWDQTRIPDEARLFSLSALTFPYQLARLVLVEQLYRVHTLLSGHPYHK